MTADDLRDDRDDVISVHVDGPAIPALLPRTWPALVDELLVDGNWSPVARAELLKSVIDTWVLAATLQPAGNVSGDAADAAGAVTVDPASSEVNRATGREDR